MSTEKQSAEYEIVPEMVDVEDLLVVSCTQKDSSKSSRKSRDNPKPSNATPPILEPSDKALMTPSVSITPINPSSSSLSLGFQSPTSTPSRPGIEIIPLATTPPASMPSSITITPVTLSQVKSIEEKSREKKASKNRSDDKARMEKKRKRKRDDSPMGPPEKIPSKQDPLSKPVRIVLLSYFFCMVCKKDATLA